MDIEINDMNPKKSFGQKLAQFWDKFTYKIGEFFANPKKRLIFICIVGIITIGAFGTGLYFLTGGRTPSTILSENKKDDKKTDQNKGLAEAPLDGLMVDPDSASRHPLGIIVENHTDARPQAGLDKASIVYEAIAEGGITRFLAIFGTHEAEKVGPVRSARTYFVDWIHGYDGYLAHVGGNMDALDKIKSEKILDLDQFSYSVPYHREYKDGLATEHTMYTSTAELRTQADKNGYPKANNFNVLHFKDDTIAQSALDSNDNEDSNTDADIAATPSDYRGDTQRISINFSQSSYNVYFEYDKKTNSYLRYLAGIPHKDQITKNQINPKNLIVMTMNRQATVTKINEPGWNMDTIGSGKAMIYLDGREIEGTWKKTSVSDREIFYDKDGNEITFNRGQFWIAVVHPDIKPIVTAE